MNRRNFLKGSAFSTLMASTGGIAGSFMLRDAWGLPVSGNGRALVNMMLIGGADLRHLFVPPANTAYGQAFWAARESVYNLDANGNWDPAQAWNPQAVLNAGYDKVSSGGSTFHISKTASWLRAQFDLGNVAVICNVKQSENRRHDHSQLIINTGNPSVVNFNFDTSGWGGRLAEFISASSNVISMTKNVSMFCKSSNAANRNDHLISAPDTRNVALQEYPVTDTTDSAVMSRSLKAYYARRGIELTEPYRQLIHHELTLRRFGARISGALNNWGPRPDLITALYNDPAILSDTNRSYLGVQMAGVFDSFIAAQEMQFKVASIELSGWDTHVQQKSHIETNLGDVFGNGKALNSLNTSIQQQFGEGVNDNLVYVITTDFGRQLKSNGTAGTDHGTGNYMLIVGNPVRGGVYGEMFPQSEISRFNEDGADIAGLTSFERVLGEVCDWVQPQSGSVVFPGRYTPGNEEPNANIASLFTPPGPVVVPGTGLPPSGDPRLQPSVVTGDGLPPSGDVR